MQIKRHQVGGAAVSAVRDDFANRIGRQVRSMSKAGPIATYEWQSLAEEFLDYLGALSVGRPDLDTPEAKAVLKDATEAAAGAVAYAAYHPHVSFQVMLDYVNFGMSYDPGGEENSQDHVTPQEWIDAFCLVILSDKATWHGEAFHFAREKFSAAGNSSVELVTGFMAQVLGDIGDDDAEYPPSAEARLGAIDAALARIRLRAEETGESLLDHSHTVALRTLRALVAGDREAFDTGLTDLLLPLSEQRGSGAGPRSLLPLLPIALAALAYRGPGWAPAVDTDYLPRALVTGFETPGPRVGGLGHNRRPDAVAALAEGPVVIDRPIPTQPLHPQSEAQFEKYTREAFTEVNGQRPAVWQLASALQNQEILFKTRASHSADVTDVQLANLRLASQLGAALFRIALAEPGTEAEVTIGGRTVAYPATRDEEASAGHWQTATNFALITGVREDLAPQVLTGPIYARKDGSAFASYREALHDYLRGEDPLPATERALHEVERAKDWGFFPPPVVLFSQLVEGDEESFNLALADALEAHRDHYQVADRADDCDAAINIDILALTCHARRRGWTIRVESPYLPQRLLQAAEPF
ncbi:immunity 49 family protein [Streptomyces sp. 2314.4]|uniref:immunity 49 family protein n=1 Tax=Streptomyces sp. 2314.4 TaxID=1881025 RepID=UPI00089C0938|nr:immunity 49 family protein [Streptomyces sp. 2314.4]SEC11530.1 Immunity protein 49 [Streptomyces sp. 2314.4]